MANERLHQGVVQGDLRKKRRNRGLLDDSDEEDEEDEMRKKKIRRSLREPKIDRDDINDLGSCCSLARGTLLTIHYSQRPTH